MELAKMRQKVGQGRFHRKKYPGDTIFHNPPTQNPETIVLLAPPAPGDFFSTVPQPLSNLVQDILEKSIKKWIVRK